MSYRAWKYDRCCSVCSEVGMRKWGVRYFSRRRNFHGLTTEELRQILSDLGDNTTYRTSQIHNWVYHHGVKNFDEMMNLPTKLRKSLNANLSIGSYEIAKEQKSCDGTIKRALKLNDGQIIEAVLMPYADGRRTACISSQVGCAMKCVFCATGQMGFSRQLSSVEIFEQAAMYSSELQRKGERLSNIVFMGMVGDILYMYLI